MIDEETAALEQKVAELADQLQAEVQRIFKDLDHNDPVVAKLIGSAASVKNNIDAARELSNDEAIEFYRRRHNPEPVYTWEHLPVYAWTNEFARLIGKLLVQLPKRLHIHAHNLAAQAIVMSNCIACGHRDCAPGEVVDVRELRTYRVIGHHATYGAMDLLEELSRVSKNSKLDVAHGMSLIGKIREHFETALAEVAEAGPQIMH